MQGVRLDDLVVSSGLYLYNRISLFSFVKNLSLVGAFLYFFIDLSAPWMIWRNKSHREKTMRVKQFTFCVSDISLAFQILIHKLHDLRRLM